ncbi:MAG: energy transducer TonB [Proteobacteria bacterium]|nr:MAG: energy transducer TonB [Pseudomonadota bacterium]
MIQRDTGIWGVALTASLLLHGGLLLQKSTLISATQGREAVQAGATRLTFRTQPRPVPPPPAAEPVPQPVREVRKSPPPQPQSPKPQPKPKPRPKPEPVAKSKPRPVPRPAEPPPPPQKSVAAGKPTGVPVAAAVQPQGDSALVEQARQTYLGLLIAHIEQHKHYPNAARRRRLGGVVEVSFNLHRGGSIEALRVNGQASHPILAQAAEQTVKNALPMPAVPAEVESPMPIRFGMEFSLR